VSVLNVTLSAYPKNHMHEKIVDAQSHLDDCHLCPHHCGPTRATATGFCRVGRTSYIASEMLHMGEEAPLRPAHAIFFSGCTATCSFCTAAKFAFRPTYGVTVTSQQLAARMVQRQQEGARSICFIGGDPAPHIPFILDTLAVLGEAIDIYLPDFKFGPPITIDGIARDCGQEIGGMPNYWPIVTQVLDKLYQKGKRLIVRHLLMPGHFECCTVPVLTWLAQRPNLEVSLLKQYLAPAHARGELAGVLSEEDVARAEGLAEEYGLRLVA